MPSRLSCFALLLALGLSTTMRGEDDLSRVKSAVKRSTLDQPGTHPFHLKAILSPSLDRDKDLGRTGEIEIWWSAPGVYRREVSSPGFHQLRIVNGGRVWEKDEGEYFPEWLRVVADAILRPLPAESGALRDVKPDDKKTLMGSTYLDWDNATPENTHPAREDVALTDSTGLLFYDGGLGWGAEFKDYKGFHGREVARTIASGDPEVTAKIVLLEDLPAESADWFNAAPNATATPVIATVVVDDTPIGPDLVGKTAEPQWPAVTNTPLKGVVWAELDLDRAGKIREPFMVISDNLAINDAARSYFAGLQFKPTLRDGVPVQVVRRVVVPFELHRPAGVEDLGTAREAFERGRKSSTLAAAAKGPYVLKASFSVGLKTGVTKGTYTDTWKDAQHWRREVDLDGSRAVRSLDGEQQYLQLDGEDAGAARLVLSIVEPIPADDTMTESDWRLKRDAVSGEPAIRVMRGDESPGVALDPKQVNAYWFDEQGHLLQAYADGLILSYEESQDFDGVSVPREILGSTSSGGIAFRLDVEAVTVLDPSSLPKNEFKLRGHEWKRQFTAETR
jgi:hypothetical protein